jgi:predicted AlkP superfamily phosphohydrolase/phosphomutase
MKSDKIILLGLDGATWDLIKPWIENNKLPSFKKLIEKGSFGNLESTIPHVTPPAWTSMSTGKNPGKHNVFDFMSIEKKNNHWKNKLYSSKSKKSEEIWDILDKKVIIVNVPLTFPPKKVNGIMITGMYTPDVKHDFTYPLEIKKEIFSVAPGYKTGLTWNSYKAKKERFIKDLYSMTDARIKIFWHLYKKDWNFYFFVFIGTDRIQHIMWENEELLRYYSYIDKFVGEVLNEIERKSITLIIASDHGFSEIKKTVYINTFLKNKKYIKNNNYLKNNNLKQKKITKEKLSELLIRYQLDKAYKKLPTQIKHIIRKKIPGKSNPEYDLNIDESVAVMIGTGSIYINSNNKKKKERISQDIINELKNLKNPDTGEKVINNVFRKEEIYSGPFLKNAPDLLILPNKGYSLVHKLSENIFEEQSFKKADHALNGIFVAYGPEIKKGFKIDAKIYDLTPTILHMFDVPIPDDIDGRVLKEIFKEKSYSAKKEIKFKERNFEKEKIKNEITKLKKSGKI